VVVEKGMEKKLSIGRCGHHDVEDSIHIHLYVHTHTSEVRSTSHF